MGLLYNDFDFALSDRMPGANGAWQQSFQKLRVYLAPSVLDIFDAHCTLNVHIGSSSNIFTDFKKRSLKNLVVTSVKWNKIRYE